MADIDIKIKIQAERAKAELARFTAQTERAAESVKQAGLRTQILEKRLEKAGRQANESTKQFRGLAGAVNSFIGNLGATAATRAFDFIGSSLTNGIDNAVTYEKALIGVARTANLTAEAQKELSDEVLELTKIIPLTNQELLGFAQIAGQLGISSVDQIAAFTETFAKLSVATNIAGEESAIAVTKILGLTNELGKNGAKNIQKFGNVITTLGNTTKTLETDIVSVGLEVAKGLAPFGLASEEILALSATLAESGVAAEAAGSSIQVFFGAAAQAAENGGDKLVTFAKAANLTTDEFKKLFNENPADAFNQIAKSLSEAGLSPAQLINRLKELGISQRRVRRSLLPLITNYASFEKNIQSANQEAKNGNALNEEAAKAFKTLGGDITRASEAFNNLVRSIVQEFQPAISFLLQSVTSLFNAFRESTILQSFAVGLGVVATALVVVAAKAVIASGAFSAVGIAASAAWVAITGPTGLVIAGLALAAGAVFALVKEWRNLFNTVRGWIGLAPLVDKANENNKKTLEDAAAAGKKNADAIKDQIDASKEKRTEDTLVADNVVTNEQKKADAIRARAEEEKRIREEERAAAQEAQVINDAEFVLATQRFEEFNQGKLESLRQFFTEEEVILAEARLLNIENERLNQLERDKLINEGNRRRLKLQVEAAKQLVNVDKVANDIIAKDNRELTDKKIQQKRREADVLTAISGFITQVAGRESKAAFIISKAAAAASIIVNTQAAAALATAQLGVAAPPAVAAIELKGGIQLATVLASAIQGFQDGGVVGGSSFTGDNVLARVNSGEMILNRQQQSQLFELANGSNQNSGQPITVNTTVELDGEVVGRSVSNQVANGLNLGEVF